jgi:hypothetical protein
MAVDISKAIAFLENFIRLDTGHHPEARRFASLIYDSAGRTNRLAAMEALEELRKLNTDEIHVDRQDGNIPGPRRS